MSVFYGLGDFAVVFLSDLIFLTVTEIQFELLCERYDEDDLTSKQIELLRLIHQNQPVLKREIKQVSILEKLLDRELVEIVKVEKRRLEIPEYSNITC